MSKELHLWTAGADPYIFAVADVTVYVHAGTPADGGGGGGPALSEISWDPGHTDVVSIVEADHSLRPTLGSVLDDSASSGTTRFTYRLEGLEGSPRIASLLGGLRQASADDLAIHVVPSDVLDSGATDAPERSDRGSRDG